MNHEQPETGIARREFLRGAGLGAGAAGAAALTLAAGAAPALAASQSANASGDGYRETDHVRRYYALARF